VLRFLNGLIPPPATLFRLPQHAEISSNCGLIGRLRVSPVGNRRRTPAQVVRVRRAYAMLRARRISDLVDST
jgi:hypothetical protein